MLFSICPLITTDRRYTDLHNVRISFWNHACSHPQMPRRLGSIVALTLETVQREHECSSPGFPTPIKQLPSYLWFEMDQAHESVLGLEGILLYYCKEISRFGVPQIEQKLVCLWYDFQVYLHK
jgi:hypothetical protein